MEKERMGHTLPAPLGPSSPKHSPLSTAMVKLRTACLAAFPSCMPLLRVQILLHVVYLNFPESLRRLNYTSLHCFLCKTKQVQKASTLDHSTVETVSGGMCGLDELLGSSAEIASHCCMHARTVQTHA